MAVTLQLGDGQDHTITGRCVINGEDYEYVSAMDGHGTGHTKNACISLMRTIDFDMVASQADPVNFIHNTYLKSHNLINSGSTFTYARINNTTRKIDVVNVGDSMTVVLKNGKIVYKSPIHCFQNPVEIERTKTLVSYIKNAKAPFPVNDIDVHLLESNIGVWNTGEILVPSQSFGHNNVTGLAPSYMSLTYELEDRVRIICGTDGFWDMNMIKYPYLSIEDPQRLINVAARKWNQQWMYYDGENAAVQTKFDHADDIGIAVWDN